MRKVIIDTDLGTDVDDAYALAFALLRPELDVLAITTSFGPTVARLRIAQRLVREVCGERAFPMAAGDGAPLTPLAPDRLARVLGEVPNQLPFAGPAGESAESGAVMLMDTLLRAHPGEVTIVTIGAMTNVARLLRDRPDVVPMVGGIASMGGSFLADKIEYNIHCDAVAAAEVLLSGVPCALFSWELTRRVLLLEPEMARLRAADTPAASAMVRLSDLWWSHRGGKPGPVIYDMCPLLHLFRPDLFTMETHAVAVETAPGPDLARTRLAEGDGCLVATDMDAVAALALLMDTLCGDTT